MTSGMDALDTIAKIADEIERIREELCTVQRSLERLKVVESVPSTDGAMPEKLAKNNS